MPKLNEAIDLTRYAAAVNGALARHRPAFLATSGQDGTPDIGPKGSMFVADAGHLAYLEYTGGGHLANLLRNAKVAVVCFDPEAEPRYIRFYGEAQLLESGALRDELRARVSPIELAQDPDDTGVIVRIRVDELVSGRTAHWA
ncbi:MAG: pyridoxamine 5'-phosphate oxidase family protein [Chloroflexi bacterium]|nr:pyridoxamine 5'-phosphate oxidase family protein [Chloroflexota bacterium]